MPARKPKPEEKPQFERFIETAKRIGADEMDVVLERVIKKISPPKLPRRVITVSPRRRDVRDS